MQTCGNKTLSLRFNSDFLVSSKCKAIFAVASFHDSSAQFFKACVVSSLQYIKLSDSFVNIQYNSILTAWNSFTRVSNTLVFSPLMLFWALIILKLWLICSKCSKHG